MVWLKLTHISDRAHDLNSQDTLRVAFAGELCGELYI